MAKLKASEIMCLVSALSAGRAPKCRKTLTCGLLADNVLANIARSGSADPLATKDSVLGKFTGLCFGCSFGSYFEHDRYRIGQWDAIPDMVQCPSWEELSKMKAAALV